MALNKWITCAVFCLLMAFRMPLYAQSGPITTHYTYRHFTTADGLPQIQCMSMMQDKDGFIWVGTKYGVARWDGRSFYTLTPKKGLSSGTIFNIFPLKDGSVAMRGQQNNLIICRGNDLKQLQMFPGDRGKHIIYVGDYDGHEFLVEIGKSISLDYSKSDLYTIERNSLIRTKILSLTNETVLFSEEGRRIVTASFSGNSYGIYNSTTIRLYVNETLTSERTFRFKNSVLSRMGGFRDQWLHPFDDISLLVGVKTTGDQIDTFHVRTGVIDYMPARPFCVTEGNGIYYIDNDMSIVHLSQGNRRRIGNVGLVNSMLLDREQNLWIGTEHGLYCFFKQGFQSITRDVSSAEIDNVWSIAGNSSGTFLFASFGKGFWMSYDHNASWVKPDYIVKFEQEDLNVRRFGTMGAHHTAMGGWVFPHLSGFLYVRQDIRKNFHFKSGYSETYFTLEDTLNHKLYISGYYTVVCLDEKTLQLDTIKRLEESDMVATLGMAFDKDGYLVSVGGGSNPRRYKNGKWELLANCPLDRTLAIYRDYRNNLWISSYDQLYFYDYHKTTYIQDLPAHSMILSLTGYKNHLIIGGGPDLIFMDLEAFYRNGAQVFQRFDAGSGLTILEGGQNSFWHGGDGSIYWPCSDRVIRFWPDRLIQRETIQKPVVLEIQVSDQDSVVRFEDFYTNIMAGITAPAGFRRLYIEFVTPTFNNNMMLRYRYRMKGTGREWQESTDGHVTILDMKPGRYVFEVQSSVDGIHWSPAAETPEIYITPFWYERSPVRAGGLLLLILLPATAILLVGRDQRRKKLHQLEQKNQMSHLRLQILRSKHIPHFSGNVFNNIDWLIESGQYREASRYISILSRLFGKMLLDGDKPARSLAEEIAFVTDYLDLEKLRYNEKLIFAIDPPDSKYLQVMIPTMIIHTLTENAVKHGLMSTRGGGHLRIGVVVKDDGLEIIVQDDGIGFVAAGENHGHSTGQGLKILKDQLAIYNTRNREKIVLHFEELRTDNGSVAGTRATLYVPFQFNYAS